MLEIFLLVSFKPRTLVGNLQVRINRVTVSEQQLTHRLLHSMTGVGFFTPSTTEELLCRCKLLNSTENISVQEVPTEQTWTIDSEHVVGQFILQVRSKRHKGKVYITAAILHASKQTQEFELPIDIHDISYNKPHLVYWDQYVAYGYCVIGENKLLCLVIDFGKLKQGHLLVDSFAIWEGKFEWQNDRAKKAPVVIFSQAHSSFLYLNQPGGHLKFESKANFHLVLVRFQFGIGFDSAREIVIPAEIFSNISYLHFSKDPKMYLPYERLSLFTMDFNVIRRIGLPPPAYELEVKVSLTSIDLHSCVANLINQRKWQVQLPVIFLPFRDSLTSQLVKRGRILLFFVEIGSRMLREGGEKHITRFCYAYRNQQFSCVAINKQESHSLTKHLGNPLTFFGENQLPKYWIKVKDTNPEVKNLVTTKLIYLTN